MTYNIPTYQTTASYQQVRNQRARLLRELRRTIQADPTDSAAREYLQERRAEGCRVPNPNRRADVERHLKQFRAMTDADLKDMVLESVAAEIYLEAASTTVKELIALRDSARY